MKNKRCPICHFNDAITHAIYGVLPCLDCRKRQDRLFYQRTTHLPEFTTDDIRDQRKAYADDIEQPHYKGQLNKRWVEINGEQAARNQGYSSKEIKNARYVYNGTDVNYYSKGDK